jgi:23S rRNA (uracil-5-)-methyltransferase RumA
MKKGQILEGIVEKVEFPNKGIVNAEGRRIVVKNSVTGQRVRFQVNKIRNGRCEARLLEVLEKSPMETKPVCPHFPVCGGCTYQNLPYEAQIRLKSAQLKEMLDEAVTAPYIFEGVKESPRRLAYRNKMEFSFGDEQKDGPLALGMHKRGSFYDIVNVNQCRIVDEDYRRILTCVSEYFQEQALPFYHKLRHTGYLRHLLVRKGAKTGEILVDLVTTTQLEAADQPWVERLLALELEGTIVSILHTYNDSLADVVQSDRTELLYGRDYFCEELLGLRFKISPFSFFQTNSLGAEVLYETARSYIGDTKDKVVFDLYSGTGTIAQMLAPVARKVVGVEIVEEAVEAARVNAGLNGLSNCTFIAGDVLKVIDDLTEKPDLIVLDPPRDGIHPKALQKIIDFGVERIVYISCKPTSLMRDLELLQGRGYKVEKAVGVDMFPGTGHVECVIMMQYCGKEKKK